MYSEIAKSLNLNKIFTDVVKDFNKGDNSWVFEKADDCIYFTDGYIMFKLPEIIVPLDIGKFRTGDLKNIYKQLTEGDMVTINEKHRVKLDNSMLVTYVDLDKKYEINIDERFLKYFKKGYQLYFYENETTVNNDGTIKVPFVVHSLDFCFVLGTRV